MGDDALKIDLSAVKLCKLPAPTAGLIAKMAKAGNDAASAFITELTGSEDGAVEPGPDATAMWVAAARAMYCVLAIEAGAIPERIR